MWMIPLLRFLLAALLCRLRVLLPNPFVSRSVGGKVVVTLSIGFAAISNIICAIAVVCGIVIA